MTDFAERIQKLTPNRLMLLALDMHEQIERAHEAIAIVGVGCRFPGGVVDADSYWQLLVQGRDATGPVPPARWDVEAWYDPDVSAPGRISVKRGGFLDAIDGFDASFFGISPREALAMDPQQRLALEVAWEALEDAGIAADSLVGSKTGVFMGICNSDYYQRLRDRGATEIDGYVASGSAPSVASGRISYSFGFRGPALTIDTACSSSLVAVHEAVKSLRTGETDVTLAGGVNLVLMPEVYVALAKAHMLSPDGRCRAFDAGANGFARGEGCGFVVLKRLSSALASGDSIIAVIRGSAINHDGRSGGLTVPSGPSQEAVIREAVADAGIGEAAVRYVEAHGTGTTLGDPIEIRALANVYGRVRSFADPLLVGSAKTNFGHLEGAAGIAGLIKAALALRHRWIPPHLHFQEPSPHIPWAEFPVRITAAGSEWPGPATEHHAAVSSFGFSGTNAHIILGPAPAVPDSMPTSPERPSELIPLSAKTEVALKGLAAAVATRLAETPADLANIAHTMAVGRSHFPVRLAVVASDAETAIAALRDYGADRESPAVRAGTSQPANLPGIAFLCTGGGAQYPGMARDLYRFSPRFRASLDHCSAVLRERTGRALLPQLFEQEDAGGFDDAALTHPALFSIQWATAELWREWGVEPTALIGHSLGEFVAATLAGVMAVEDALWLVAERARLLQSLPQGGAMCAVLAPSADVVESVTGFPGVEIAAINGPEHVVLTGERAGVTAAKAHFESRGFRCQLLHLAQAFHSARLDPILDQLQLAAERVSFRAPLRPLVSNVTGRLFGSSEVPDAKYWREHARATVRFGDGVQTLSALAPKVYLEIGPHPVLLGMARASVTDPSVTWIPSLRRGQPDWPVILDAAATLYARGVPIDWPSFDGPYGRSRVPSPRYPFERKSFWIANNGLPDRRVGGQTPARDSSLGFRLPTAAPAFEQVLRPDAPGFLAAHRVQGRVVVPGPLLLGLGLAAAREADRLEGASATAIEFTSPLVLPDEGRVVQVQLAGPKGARRFEVHSRPVEEPDRWTIHARGVLQGPSGIPDVEALESVQARCSRTVTPEAFYQGLEAAGIEIGQSIRVIRSVEVGRGEAVGVLAATDAVGPTRPLASLMLIDASLHLLAAAASAEAGSTGPHLLAEVGRAILPAALIGDVRCVATVRSDPRGLVGSVTIFGLDGTPIGHLSDLLLKALAGEPAVPHHDPAGWLHRVVWEHRPLSAPRERGLATIAEPAQAAFDRVAIEAGFPVYDDLLPALDGLGASYIAEALGSMGHSLSAGSRAAAADPDELGVMPRYRPLFAALVAGFDRLGMAGRTPASDQLAASLAQRFSAADSELSILRRCGPHLADVLRGRVDAVGLLFPGGSLAEARQLYVESPSAKTYNTALASTVAQSLRDWPADRPLRVLEIGAGTGGTTGYLLPVLDGRRVEYTFTDVSPHFLADAERRFAGHSWLKGRVLDIERDPEGQGFRRGAYDFVVAANVLHATADLGQALRHTRSLLRPGGTLFLLEGTHPDLWVTLTFGLTEGWWRSTDQRQGNGSPLVGRAAWESLLGQSGFGQPEFVPGQTALVSASRQVVILARAEASRSAPHDPTQWTLVADPADATALALVRRVERGSGAAKVLDVADVAGLPAALAAGPVVYLGALSLPVGTDLTDDQVDAIGQDAGTRPLGLLRQAATVAGARVWLVTRGAQATSESERVSSPSQAPLWGLGRVFSLEHPDQFGAVIDLDPAADPDQSADTLFAELTETDGVDQVAYRDGRRLVPHLEKAPRSIAPVTNLDPAGSYLISGGFGGLGLALARHLAIRGAGTIALMGRRAARLDSPDVAAIERLGAAVVAFEGDVADEPWLRHSFARFGSDLPPLRGVIHAAAAISSRPIGSLSDDLLREMYHPKVRGTVVLARLTAPLPLDFWVGFSSTTALLGVRGFGHYAAANCFLDGFVQGLDSGRRMVSIDWGIWEVMRLASTKDQAAFEAGGLRAMALAPATDILLDVAMANRRGVVVASVEWRTLRANYESRRPRPMLEFLGGEPAAAIRRAPVLRAGLIERIRQVPPDRRREVALLAVSAEVRGVLRIGPGDPVTPDQGLFEMGMDSLMSVELKTRLETITGLTLPSTLTFNYPNPDALAAYLVDRSEPAVASVPPSAAASPGPIPPGERPHEELTDDELEAALIARLRKLE